MIYNFLEKFACRFLIWRFKVGYGDQCNTMDDWKDGEILERGGCAACKAGFTMRFLEEHIELLDY
jgi:hypothetical protein